MNYGLISETDARTIERTLDLVFEGFPDVEEIIKTCEVGVYSGKTSKGITEYVFNKGRRVGHHTGIDNGKDREKMVDFPIQATFIEGSSNEVCWRLRDNSKHFIFIDACHCFAHVISDFFCYAPKVKPGGFLAFHDTGKHIKPMKDFQHGDKDNPDAYISVRKSLNKLCLINDGIYEMWFHLLQDQWKLIFDEADDTNEAGGICVFKKLY